MPQLGIGHVSNFGDGGGGPGKVAGWMTSPENDSFLKVNSLIPRGLLTSSTYNIYSQLLGRGLVSAPGLRISVTKSKMIMERILTNSERDLVGLHGVRVVLHSVPYYSDRTPTTQDRLFPSPYDHYYDGA